MSDRIYKYIIELWSIFWITFSAALKHVGYAAVSVYITEPGPLYSLAVLSHHAQNPHLLSAEL